ncbi:MAG: hypothetical protein NXI24_01530 [bacterium]|nr:hypothetical protein [bacterium]
MVRLLKSFKGVDIQKIPIHLQAKDDQVFPEAYYLIYNLCIVDGFIDLQRSEYQWADAPNHKFFSRVQKMVLHPELAGGAPIVETPEMGGGDRLFVSEQFMLAIQTEFTKSELLTLDFYDPDDPIQLMKAL